MDPKRAIPIFKLAITSFLTEERRGKNSEIALTIGQACLSFLRINTKYNDFNILAKKYGVFGRHLFFKKKEEKEVVIDEDQTTERQGVGTQN